MFVLDGLRARQTSHIPIPRFHNGHLGFVPGLEVQNLIGRAEDHGREITLTPFQGDRSQLFLLKCVFRDNVGVVLKALSAFAALKINVLSLESATINGGRNHVLFCILSWGSSPYTNPIPLDEAAQQKFVELLPLLPNTDARYLLLLEMLFLFCRDALDHEELRGQHWLPKIQLRLFDGLEDKGATWASLKLQKEQASKYHEPYVFVDLQTTLQTDNADVILLSETETKTLRLIFPSPKRRGRFLRLAFHHQNSPGALLAIATLLSELKFNIVMSLLRISEEPNRNVWETTLEFEGGDASALKTLPDGIERVDWFRSEVFSKRNLKVTAKLMKHLQYYKVGVCLPIYPPPSTREHCKQRDLLERNSPAVGEEMAISKEEFDHHMQMLGDLREGSEWAPLARLTHGSVARKRRNDAHRGTVFLSLPASCRQHGEIITKRFKEELGLTVEMYIEPNAENITETALGMIRAADFFFALWHYDENNNTGEVSPWMPFEYGAARCLGKKTMMLYHAKLRNDVKRRIDPHYSGIEYTNLSFHEKVEGVIKICRRQWLQPSDGELLIDI